MSIKRLAFWYLLTVPLLAGVSTLQVTTDSGLTVTGIAWVIQLAIGLLLAAALLSSKFDYRELGVWLPWVAWCAWICLSLLWCEETPGRRHLQEASQLSMPFVMGVIAMLTIRTRDDLVTLMRCFPITFFLVAIFAFIFAAEMFDKEWLDERARPAALTAALCGCVFLASFPQRIVWPLAGWIGCLLITTMTQSRMATMGLLSLIVVHPLYRSKRWNLVMLCVFAVAAVGLFYTPVFQERFFPKGNGTLGDVASGDFSSAGRFEMWPRIWEEAWNHPLLGSGVGVAYSVVPLILPPVTEIHNDYLRIFFELGMLGFVLFITIAVWQMIELYRRIAVSDGIVRTAFAAVWLGFCVLWLSCATDNTILYNIYYTDSLFAILGGAYGVMAAENVSLKRRMAGAVKEGARLTTPAAKPRESVLSMRKSIVKLGLLPALMGADFETLDDAKRRLLVSVIIPLYNRINLAADTIESVLAQTRLPDECIVIDDGSTEDITPLVNKFGSQVKFIRQANQGVSTARNRGMAEAQGDAFLFLDSDDLIMPTCLDRLVSVLEERPEVDVVYPDCYLVDQNAKPMGIHSQMMPGPRPSNFVLGELACCCFLNMSAVMVRRSGLKGEIFETRMKFGEDYDFWRKLAVRCNFHYVDEPLMSYRYHGTQATKLNVMATLDGEIIVQQRIMEMPEFSKVPRKLRSRAYCHHGAKQGILGNAAVARGFFWKAICASPTNATAHALMGLSLMGNRVLQYAVLKRRRIIGNHIDADAGDVAISKQKMSDTKTMAVEPELVGTSAEDRKNG